MPSPRAGPPAQLGRIPAAIAAQRRGRCARRSILDDGLRRREPIKAVAR